MTWLTWRQQRLEALIGGIAVGLVVIFLVWTGHSMISAYEHDGVATCVASHTMDNACGSIVSAFEDRFRGIQSITSWLNFLPLFIGLLLAAPFILEFEHGTHRLAWTQSISRGHWLASKLGWMLGLAIVLPLGLSLLWRWWGGPLDQMHGRFDGNEFSFEGIVPIAYTVFALAVCVFVGILLRRTAPAMAITFAVFLGMRVVIENKLRPHYLAPLKITHDVTSATPAGAHASLGNGDWILSQNLVFPAGTTARDVLQACGAIGDKTSKSMNGCLQAHGVVSSIVYQPADRFWIFQGFESAIFLGLAVALLAVTVWWVLRRIV